MKGLAITDKGLENIALKEIFEKIKTKGDIDETIALFEIKSEKDLCKLAYTCQSVRRILKFITKVKIEKNFEKTLKNFEKEINKINIKEFKNKIIKVECERQGEHDFNSVDLTREISIHLKNIKLKISRDNPDIILYIYIHNNKGYVTIDYSGRDLSKRTYRIFTKATSLKGTLAFSLLKFADYKPGDILVDPLCGSGEIPIEAALMATKKPVHFYKKDFIFQKINSKFEKIFDEEDSKIKIKVKNINSFDNSLSNIHTSKKNAKIAGVDKLITFSKIDLEWLDTKFEKEEVDKIVTKLASDSKRVSETQIQKTYEEFFRQTEYILKKKGLIIVCSMKNELLKKIAEKKKLKVFKEHKIFSGHQEFFVTIFKKFL